MVKGNVAEGAPEAPERVEIAAPDGAEIMKFDPELERRMGDLHEISLVDAEAFDEEADVWERRFPDTHDADFFRLYEAHVAGMGKLFHQRCSGHPAGGATPKDDDTGLGKLFLTHQASLRKNRGGESPPDILLLVPRP
jgi:hypothetical protein